MSDEVFKLCTNCGTSWPTCADFVADPTLEVTAYQACFEDPEGGVFLLTHGTECCGTTLAIAAGRFRSLYFGPQYTERRTGQSNCPGLCLQEGRLEECEADCDLAWIRSALQHLRRHEMPAPDPCASDG
jgi:hypothetical protein